jgi:hypothetical protein
MPTTCPHERVPLRKLQAIPGFTFHKLDISEKSIIEQFKNERFDGCHQPGGAGGGESERQNPWVYFEATSPGP